MDTPAVDSGEAPGLPSSRRQLRPHALAAVVFLVHLYLVHPAFLPTLSEINPFDEAAYLNSGRTLLVQGGEAFRLPNISDNPLVDVFYALTYLPFRTSPGWLTYSAALGRLLLFSLLWLSAYLVARALSDRAPPEIAIGLLLVSPLAVEMLRFPSDPLFAGLAGLGFWGLLRYHAVGARRHLAFASAALGLAALARNDGLLLYPIFLGLAFWLVWRRERPAGGFWRGLAAAVLPFAALMGGYLLVYGAVMGEFKVGTLRRTYDNFEAGHQSIYAGAGDLNPVIEAKLEARRVFGTPEENGYSVLRAIRRAPSVYLQRLIVTARGLPQKLLQAYGQRFAALFFLLAGRGLIALLRRREIFLAAAFTLWAGHLASGFWITLFRPGHLQFPYYLVLALAGLGLAELLGNLARPAERNAWLVALLGLSAYGVVDQKLAIFYGAATFLVALAVVYALTVQAARAGPLEAAPLLVLLAAGLVIHGNFPTPRTWSPAEDVRAQAAEFMAANLEAGTRVAAGAPGVVWAARMEYAAFTATDVPVGRSPESFTDWMAGQDIRAIYVDHSLYNANPAVWALIKPQIGGGRIERVFSADQGDIQVLLIGE